MIVNKPMTFDDIEKLNYKQFNQVSNKYGEDEFNPADIFEATGEGSDSE